MQLAVEEIKIRRGTAKDIEGVYALIEEQAIHHNEDPAKINNSVEQMHRDGTGENPFFHFFVAEFDGEIIGTTIYYYTYSTFKGKALYMEDLFVKKMFRGNNLGKTFMQYLAAEAIENGAQKMKWQVIEGNDIAIRFYEKMDATVDTEWTNYELSRHKMELLEEEVMEMA